MEQRLTDLMPTVRKRITGTELDRYKDDKTAILSALTDAAADINQRRGYTPTEDKDFEAAYGNNIIRGAIWYLLRKGAEGTSSVSENGEDITWRETPEWLEHVIPRVYMG